MDKKTKYGFIAVLVALVGCMTLGAVGTTAMTQHFHWITFVADLCVYAFLVYKLFKKGQED